MLINDEEVLDFPFNFIILKGYNYEPASDAAGADFLAQESGDFLFLLEDGSGVIELE